MNWIVVIGVILVVLILGSLAALAWWNLAAKMAPYADERGRKSKPNQPAEDDDGAEIVSWGDVANEVDEVTGAGSDEKPARSSGTPHAKKRSTEAASGIPAAIVPIAMHELHRRRQDDDSSSSQGASQDPPRESKVADDTPYTSDWNDALDATSDDSSDSGSDSDSSSDD